MTPRNALPPFHAFQYPASPHPSFCLAPCCMHSQAWIPLSCERKQMSSLSSWLQDIGQLPDTCQAKYTAHPGKRGQARISPPTKPRCQTFGSRPILVFGFSVSLWSPTSTKKTQVRRFRRRRNILPKSKRLRFVVDDDR